MVGKPRRILLTTLAGSGVGKLLRTLLTSAVPTALVGRPFRMLEMTAAGRAGVALGMVPPPIPVVAGVGTAVAKFPRMLPMTLLGRPLRTLLTIADAGRVVAVGSPRMMLLITAVGAPLSRLLTSEAAGTPVGRFFKTLLSTLAGRPLGRTLVGIAVAAGRPWRRLLTALAGRRLRAVAMAFATGTAVPVGKPAIALLRALAGRPFRMLLRRV